MRKLSLYLLLFFLITPVVHHHVDLEVEHSEHTVTAVVDADHHEHDHDHDDPHGRSHVANDCPVHSLNKKMTAAVAATADFGGLISEFRGTTRSGDKPLEVIASPSSARAPPRALHI